MTLDAGGEPAGRRCSSSRGDLALLGRRADRWVVEGGEYEVAVGASSRDLRATALVGVIGDGFRPPITGESTLDEVLADPEARESILPLLASAGEALGMDVAQTMGSIPVGRLSAFGGGQDGAAPAVDPETVAP